MTEKIRVNGVKVELYGRVKNTVPQWFAQAYLGAYEGTYSTYTYSKAETVLTEMIDAIRDCAR